MRRILDAMSTALRVHFVSLVVSTGAVCFAGPSFAQPRRPAPAPRAEAARPSAGGIAAASATTQSGSTPSAVSEPGGQPVTGQTTLHPGDAVAVEWQNQWYSGHVVTLVGNTVRVHYDGYDASQDETVARTRLRVNSTAFRPRPGAVEPTGLPVLANAVITPGVAIQINWHGQWWAGRVIAAMPDGFVIVRYDGREASADAMVTRDRILLVPAGATASIPAGTTAMPNPPGQPVDAQTSLSLGQPVHIEWSGSFYPGRVIALLDGGQVRVHYLGYGDDSDENVPRARLRIGVGRPVIVGAAAQSRR
jgi:hypothetical protein